jgi:hypothetical protein
MKKTSGVNSMKAENIQRGKRMANNKRDRKMAA